MDVGKVIVTEEDVDKSKQDIIMIKEEYEKVNSDIFEILQFS